MRELIGKKPLPPHPFFPLYQPLAALRAWANFGIVQRIAPVQVLSGRAPLSGDMIGSQTSNVAVSCQLAVLWAHLAEKMYDVALAKAADDLAGFLAPIVSEGLTTLWTPEREYREEESRLSSNLLLRAMGHAVPFLDSEVFPFSLENVARINPAKEVYQDPSIGYELVRGEEATIALTGGGWQTSAGAARVGDLEIPAFGPHLAPLSNSELFGVGPGEDGWFCAYSAKEVWLRARGTAGTRCIGISLDSVGVQTEAPLAFVFYIRADECRVAGRVFKPQSLARFSGEADAVEFTVKSSKIGFLTEPGLKLEIIPLAGDGAFWGATFLLAAWLPSYQATTNFRFQSILGSPIYPA